MALQQGVASASGVCKTYPSTSITTTTNRLIRRRGRGSLVRCRAFVWSREDLDHLNALSMLPRHQLSQDVIEQHIGDTCTFTKKSFRNSIDSDRQPYVGIRRDAHLSQEGGGTIIKNETITLNHSTSTKIPHHYDHSQPNFIQSVEENISLSDHSDKLHEDLSNSKLRRVKLNESCFETISQEDETQNDDDDECNSYSSDFNDSKTQTQTVTGISATLIDLTL